MEKEVLKELLDAFYDRYDTADFIENDPVSVPHLFTGREDREIAGFLAATVAWGNRRAIVRSGRRMMELMDGAPYEFMLHASPEELRPLGHFVHRTFNGTDFIAFVLALRRLCTVWGGIGQFSRNVMPRRATCVSCLPNSGVSFSPVTIPSAAKTRLLH